MALDLSRVKQREALPHQREPHWQRIRPGCFLGYRSSAREGAGTWIARAYDGDRRRYAMRALGDFAKEPGKDRFAFAKAEAETFATFVEAGGCVQRRVETVGDVCRAYAEARPEAVGRFKRFVYSDPIASVRLGKLRRHHVLAWRQRHIVKPALVSRRKKGPQKTRPRAPSTVNREMAVLRAALYQFLPPGAPNTEAAWQDGLKAIRNANGRRTLYLDRDQRRALLAAIDSEAEPFVRALCLLPLRPGATSKLCARDFDPRTSELTIRFDKTGRPRRILLSPAAAALFRSQAEGKHHDAPLFARQNGQAWSKESWKDPIALAVVAAALPAGATAYTLRHSTITDLVMAGLPLLTIGQISDTSAEMIERHYGHLIQHAAAEALSPLTL